MSSAGRAASSRVQDGGQTAGAPTADQEPPMPYQDALFFLIAEGRRPTGAEVLVFFSAFSSALSLVFITSDLMNARPAKPASLVIFLVSTTYCGVLVRRQRVAAAQFAAEESRLAAEARRPPSMVIDKETRRRLLDYFVFRPPEEKEGDNESAAQREEGDAIGSSGRGARFSKGVRGVLSLLPSLNPAASPPHPPEAALPSPGLGLAAQAPTTRGGGAGGADGQQQQQQQRVGTGDCEEGGLAAAAAAADASTVGIGMSATADDLPAAEDTKDPYSVTSVKEPGEEGAGCTSPGDDSGLKIHKPDEDQEEDEVGSEVGSCIVCFGDYAFGEELCRLPCRHLYHAKCIDEWFDGANHGWCPLCKTPIDVLAAAASVRSANRNNSSSNNNNNNSTGQEASRWRRQRRNSNDSAA